MARNNVFTPIQFCNVRLNDVAKKDFHKWAGSDEYDLDALLSHMVDVDHKVTFSYDAKNQTYLASMTCKDSTSANNDCCVVSRAETLAKAIAVMLYKFYVLLSGEAWTTFATDDDWG